MSRASTCLSCAVVALLTLSVARAQDTNAAANIPKNATNQPDPHLIQAQKDAASKNLDGAVKETTLAIQDNPKNADAYLMRGAFYAQQQKWTEAEQDYNATLALTSHTSVVKFDLAELKFLQKQYDDARPLFAALMKDEDVGELATYKVLLCDMLAGHPEAADRDLAAINKVGDGAPYYFGNAAYSLIQQHKPESARPWLESAGRIYGHFPQKMSNYTYSLRTLGYLPLPPKPAQ